MTLKDYFNTLKDFIFDLAFLFSVEIIKKYRKILS